ncbi:unnamed protein product [Dovyalis caffra]|uniref:Uncharacterized protein n=1 Tax=Dovyalis caffra TaxID=77055 RepID=A0AAV1RQA8_9ROSI|nr:unnamed protein product [Dovyalis caffra]
MLSYYWSITPRPLHVGESSKPNHIQRSGRRGGRRGGGIMGVIVKYARDRDGDVLRLPLLEDVGIAIIHGMLTDYAVNFDITRSIRHGKKVAASPARESRSQK